VQRITLALFARKEKDAEAAQGDPEELERLRR